MIFLLLLLSENSDIDADDIIAGQWSELWNLFSYFLAQAWNNHNIPCSSNQAATTTKSKVSYPDVRADAN